MLPLLGPLLGLIAGILLSPCLDLRAVWICLPAVALLCTLRFGRRVSVALVFTLLGATLKSREPAPPPETHELDDVASRVVGIVQKAPEWRGPGVYLDIKLLSIDSRACDGQARLTEFLELDEARTLFEALDLGSGDRVEILVKLHRPQVYRDDGVFNYRRYLDLQQIYWTGTIRSPRLITVLQRGSHGTDRIRNWIAEKISGPLQDDPEAQGLMLAMTLGRKNQLAASLERQFQAGGVYHLLIVSGFTLSAAAAVAFWLLRVIPGIPLKRTGRLILVWLFVAGYVAVADSHTATWRAALMTTIVIAGKLLDRGRSLGNSIAASGVAILLWRPGELEDAGFQMTFAAVTAAAALGIPLTNWAFGWIANALADFANPERDARIPAEIADWRVARRLWCEMHGLPFQVVTIPWRVLRRTCEVALISACIEAALTYFMVESFHRLSPIAPLLNIPSTMLASLAVPLALLLVVSQGPLASGVAATTRLLLHGFLRILTLALSLPFSTFRTPSAPPWVWALYAAAFAGAIAAVRWRCRILLATTCAVLASLQFVLILHDFTPPAPKAATLTFLDVGQGDSILVEFPDGRRMLIDGGGVAAGRFLDLRDESTFSIGENVVSAYLFGRGIRTLDVVVLTHAHIDHLQGLLNVIENFKVGEIWLGRNPMVPAYKTLIELVQQKQIPIRWVYAGQQIGPFTVLHPPSDWRPRVNDENNDSVVLLLKAAGATALLTGDIERNIAAPQRVDLLKVPHHGSGGVKLHVEAPVRVISVGANNPFGHPSPSALPALRTDRLGAVTVILGDGRAQVADTHLTGPCASCKLAFLFNGH